MRVEDLKVGDGIYIYSYHKGVYESGEVDKINKRTIRVGFQNNKNYFTYEYDWIEKYAVSKEDGEEIEKTKEARKRLKILVDKTILKFSRDRIEEVIRAIEGIVSGYEKEDV